jgi:enoyl-CoA hydratase
MAEELADQINANPPLSVRCNVRVMRHFADEMRREASYFQEGLQLHSTEDFKESARAFVEKRKPVFQGR